LCESAHSFSSFFSLSLDANPHDDASFDAPDDVGPPTNITTTTATTSIGSGEKQNSCSNNCVVEVCGPANVWHGGWSKSDDTIFIREVAHACAIWERLQLQQQQITTSQVRMIKQVGGDPAPGGQTPSGTNKLEQNTSK